MPRKINLAIIGLGFGAEFIPMANAVKSANWTCVALCAHQSALAGGKIVRLPTFTRG